MHGAKLDPFLVARSLNGAVNKDTRRVDLVGIQLADLDELLDFGHADLAAAGDHRVEVSRGFSKNEIAGFVTLPCFHERDLGLDAGFEHVFFVGKNFRLLAFGQFGAEAGASVKPRDSSAARAQPLGERALRDEFEIEFTRQHLALELLVLAHVGGDDFLHLAALE